MDIQYPDKVDHAATNVNTILHLRQLAIKEYAQRANISPEEAEKQMLIPEDNNIGAVHGLFRGGLGEEINDVENLLKSRPSDKSWLKRWWDGDEKKEAQNIWNNLDTKAGEVADEIREKVN